MRARYGADLLPLQALLLEDMCGEADKAALALTSALHVRFSLPSDHQVGCLISWESDPHLEQGEARSPLGESVGQCFRSQSCRRGSQSRSHLAGRQ